MLDNLIGSTTPVGDEAVDHKVEEHLKLLIDVTNWCLDGIADTARHKHSDYRSERRVGERAFSACLDYMEWLMQLYADDGHDIHKRIIYRGEVFNALESERIKVLPNIANSHYMNGVHDGIRKAQAIIANEVKDIY